MISIPSSIESKNYYNNSFNNTDNNNFCYKMEINIQPYNSVGLSNKITKKTIYITKNGKKNK